MIIFPREAQDFWSVARTLNKNFENKAPAVAYAEGESIAQVLENEMYQNAYDSSMEYWGDQILDLFGADAYMVICDAVHEGHDYTYDDDGFTPIYTYKENSILNGTEWEDEDLSEEQKTALSTLARGIEINMIDQYRKNWYQYAKDLYEIGSYEG